MNVIQTDAPAETRETSAHLARFEEFERSVPASGPAWLRTVRVAGISHFAEQGFPTTRQEEWIHTDVTPIARMSFEPATRPADGGLTAETLAPFGFGATECQRLVFVDGHFAPHLSTRRPRPAGLKLGSLAAAIHSDGSLVERHLARHARYTDNPFVALNTAFIQDGAFIHLPARLDLAEPIHLLFVSTRPGSTSFPRNLIVVERSSSVRIIEDYVSLAREPHFTCPVTEMVAGENAQIEHCKIQRENLEAFHVATVQAQQSSDSRVISHSISIGARLARNHIQLALGGPGVNALLNGLFVARHEQLVDHHTVVDHASPHCASHEFYHGVLGGMAHGVFNGKILVRPDAQKTDAKQTNRNLLLSDRAVINTKPQLEIFADDVKCTHGATVGQLDEAAIFYLRSRGIGAERARRMLVQAFASDVLNRISIEPVRAELDDTLSSLLEGESPEP